MSLVFAGIVPNTPLLVPEISKDRVDVVKKTAEAMNEMREHLYIARPDIVIVISPYMKLFDTAYSVNAHTPLETDFSEFGNLTTSTYWNGSPTLAAAISKKARRERESVQLVSDEKVDHGISVPLLLLAQELRHISILPIGPKEADSAALVKFGELLKEIIYDQHKRVAVIVSGHLSHHEGKRWFFKSKGEEFDKTLIGHLEQKNTAAIITMDKAKINDAHETIYSSLLILLGILKNTHYEFKTYCYESPVGVGYLTGNFNI